MVRRLVKSRRGFTGIEAAIVLIAFVVVAAVFSFVALNMGMLATEKSKDAISVSISTATASLARVGLVYGYSSLDDTDLENVVFFVKLSQRSSTTLTRTDFKLVYTETGAAPDNLVPLGGANDPDDITIDGDTEATPGTDFVFANTATGQLGDETVDYGELWIIILDETPDDNDVIIIELLPPVGASLSFTARVPADTTTGTYTLDVISA